MRSSKPPALATWLVEHLIPGDNEALTGDLIEQFRQGRSIAWYWRQAIVAILVGFAKEVSILWIAIAVTVVWIFALSQFYGRFWVFAQAQAFTIWGMRHGWMLSRAFTIGGFVVFNALPVAFAVGMYLGLTRMFSPRRFLRGLVAGLLTFTVGVYLCFMQSPKWLLHHQGFVGHFVASLPMFFGLLVSMWAGRPDSAERRKGQSVLA
jgi:hypothetical protein